MVPFPPGLGGEVIEGAELVDLDVGIAGAASFYVNNTRPLTGVHRGCLKEYLADLGQEIVSTLIPQSVRHRLSGPRAPARRDRGGLGGRLVIGIAAHLHPDAVGALTVNGNRIATSRSAERSPWFCSG